jgi:Bifunctional DNA primase/polymerase, N-terminal
MSRGDNTGRNAGSKDRARNVEVAIWAAERGWPVLKVSIGTKRVIEEWRDLGYRDPGEVRRIWRNEAVGIKTGLGLVYDDLDVDDEGNPAGEWSLESILPDGNWGKLPRTFELHSPSGGRGLLWLPPRGREFKTCSGQVAPHFDVRGRMGMFVLYDSSRPGRFVTDWHDPVVMPWWLSELHPEPGSRVPSGGAAGKSDVAGREWLAKYGGGEPCAMMAAERGKMLHNLRYGATHDVMTSGVYALIGECVMGHAGLNAALWDVRDAFYAAMQGKSRRGERVADWRNSINGAIARKMAASRGRVAGEDPCTELEGLWTP